ncbi:hypothetical protein ACFWJM_04180 [Streptomyces sp. NPDC127077]|uniref:hypothetical protein n=1 Tax=Streptomyces sp. NPDC127077 TaxID=3347131 RepID=UPI003663351A
MHTSTSTTTTVTATVTAALLLAAATGCTAGGDTTKPTTDSDKTRAAERSTSAKPSPNPKGPRAFGGSFVYTTDGATMAMTALRYEQGNFHLRRSADEEFGTTGYTWAAVEMKACLKNGFAVVTRNSWVLAYADGARIKPSSVTYDDFPRPEYPRMATVKAGTCVRGKTVFAVPAKQRPVRVLYTSTTPANPAEWSVPKG